uniref:protein FAM200B-like n=1 Tax=Styela clava TaxID=7725 RepID=UPI0019392BEF|nr:protein FAM200B-like [Styela clava]
MLKRVFLLRKEIHEFLRDVKPEMHKNFSDDRFLMFLSFLVDIFESVNSVNLALQGKEVNVIHCHEKLTAFNMKLSLWHSKLDKKTLAPFPHLNGYLDENELQISDDIIEVMKSHVSILSEEITHYFPDLQDFE